jgi:hypothetical protein
MRYDAQKGSPRKCSKLNQTFQKIAIAKRDWPEKRSWFKTASSQINS